MRIPFSCLLALGLALAACSSESSDTTRASTTTTTTTATTTTTTSTTTSTTTTTTVPSPDVSPVNGLEVEDPSLAERRVLAVKIDNHPRANPQSGIEEADMVIELLVEGITRYLTIWHQSDSEFLGPMRSGRPTDPTLLSAFNEPTFAISGAQGWVQSVIRSKGIPLIKELSPGTFRVSGRSAPHNLYVDTIALRATADDRGHPDEGPREPIWEFGDLPPSATPASSVRIDFSGNTVVWDWDADSEAWVRTAYGRESTYRDPDGETGPIAFPVLVALHTEQYTASPPSGQSGKGLPSSRTTGGGKAYVFAGGEVVEGTWERETEDVWFTLVDGDGSPLPVPPGQVWVSLVPSGRAVSITE